MRVIAASHALAGRLGKAEEMVAHLRDLNPALRLSNLADVLPPFRRSDDRDRYIEELGASRSTKVICTMSRGGFRHKQHAALCNSNVCIW